MTPQKFCWRYRLNQSQFGERVGLTKPTISRLFNGKPLSIKSAIQIEKRTGGMVTRADVRPELRPLTRKQLQSLRKSTPIPATVPETETARQVIPNPDA